MPREVLTARGAVFPNGHKKSPRGETFRAQRKRVPGPGAHPRSPLAQLLKHWPHEPQIEGALPANDAPNVSTRPLYGLPARSSFGRMPIGQQ